MARSGAKKRRNSIKVFRVRVGGSSPEHLPTISEDDRKELRQDLFDFVKNQLGASESRANYLADTYSLISKSD